MVDRTDSVRRMGSKHNEYSTNNPTNYFTSDRYKIGDSNVIAHNPIECKRD
jgi:hypothetical protein